MARYTGPVCRICRREGIKLYLKGDRCYTDKCALARRNYAPGQHGQNNKKLTNYGIQLREKQKVRKYYGVLEGQFAEAFKTADKMAGKTGDNLLKLMELRFDNVIYRLGFASSRPEARQLVVHGHFTVNGKKADIPSMTLQVGDVIKVKEKSQSSDKFKTLMENHKKTAPQWLQVEPENFTGRLIAEPVKEDIEIPIEEHLIVELYSK
ncbi:MAG: 30S ribosomal protein S4 [Sedimentibacter sp.]|uniref:30S ribosomal protein S4 n=1 Tax=Sedimentibacter sp. TaxID=1960295 RepID=UPI002981939B|nr:30S ribosomal protein S4 [Sedimentibacter sp.]MDW5298641.1 30S ribosomal protein S4 [Sedimentibacter sp.]